jgi:DNA-directed RNA polymerase omega subunit
MNPVTIDQLLAVIPNKYLLTMVIAARAKQLERGAKKLIATDISNSLDIAIMEIAGGMIDVEDLIAQSNERMLEQLVEEKQMIEDDAGVGEYIDHGDPGRNSEVEEII